MPLSSDMLNLKDPTAAGKWDSLSVPLAGDNENFYLAGPFAPRPDDVAAAQGAAISGAATRMIDLFFCNSIATQQWCDRWRKGRTGIKYDNFKNPDGSMSRYSPSRLICLDYGRDPRDSNNYCDQPDPFSSLLFYQAAFEQGEKIAELVSQPCLCASFAQSQHPTDSTVSAGPQVFEQFNMVKLLQDTPVTLNATYPDIADVKTDQQQATVHNCSFPGYKWWRWQALKVPRVSNTTNLTAAMIDGGYFRPGPGQIYPPASYTLLNTNSSRPPVNASIPFFRGQAATIAKATLRSIEAARTNGSLLEGLNGPPASKGQTSDQVTAFRRAMQEVLQVSASLDDRKKVIAECE